MSKKLYPITMRPGIKRDGTPFQSEYCTDADWVRWQKGMPRAMGGMNGFISLPSDIYVSDILSSNFNQGGKLLFFATAGNNNSIIMYGRQGGLSTIGTNATPNLIWQLVIVQRGSPAEGNNPGQAVQPYLVAYGCPNARNVANNNGGTVNLAIEINQLLNPDAPPENAMREVFRFDAPNPTDVDGGMCYAAPYLFLYGTNGTVRVSRPSDCFDFRTQLPEDEINGAGAIMGQIYTLPTGDKVIFGTQIRGGNTNSPTLLFWTLTSVIRFSFITAENKFKPDVISTASSIISSKCVVEYDGIFYWIGDRFYVYNGVVNTLVNTLSLDFFFNNVNRRAASLIFGVKFSRFNEIWWFFPVGDSPVCNHVIIYNTLEKNWYDVALSRTAGTYSQLLNTIITAGKPKVTDTEENFIFRHEVAVDESCYGNAPVAINRYFYTPFYSFASFTPIQQEVGIDNLTTINRLEPDFITTNPNNHPCVITPTLFLQEYAQSVPAVRPLTNITVFPKNFADSTNPPDQTVRIDTAIQGGHIQIRFLSTSLFEMGHNLIQLSMGDGRR